MAALQVPKFNVLISIFFLGATGLKFENAIIHFF